MTWIAYHHHTSVTFITADDMSSSVASSDDKTTASVKRNLNISFTASLSSNKNSDASSDFNKQIENIEMWEVEFVAYNF